MTLVIAHRGASAAEPENSLAAFRRAVVMGADGIELDVHATVDGGLVVVHDELLDGRPIPTLAESLAAIGRATTVFVEVKTLAPQADLGLLAALDAGPAPSRYHLHSFDHRIMQRLKKRAPERTYGVLSCSRPVNPLEQLRAAGATELWQNESLIDGELVETLHRAQCTVLAWTVDDPARARALRDLGVDGICTNRPDSVRAALG